MQVTKTAEHAWLQQMIGEWTGEGEASMGPGTDPMKWTVEETVRGIGEVWVQGESRGTMPDGQPSIMVITLGYDSERKRFTGTFVGSMMTHLWIYDGEFDSARNILTLNAEGPSMAGDGAMAKYQDIVEVKSPDHRLLRSRMQAADGTWNEFMVAHYRRRK